MVVTHTHPELETQQETSGVFSRGVSVHCFCVPTCSIPGFICVCLIPSTLHALIYLWVTVGGTCLVSPRSEHNQGIRPLCFVTPGTWWHTSPSTRHLTSSDCSLLYCPVSYCARSLHQCVALSSNTPFTNTSRVSDLRVAALDLGPLFLSPFGSDHYNTPHPPTSL